MKLILLWLAVLLLPGWLTVIDAFVAQGDPYGRLPGSLLYVSLLVAFVGCSIIAGTSPLRLSLKLLAIPATAVLLVMEVLVLGIIAIMMGGLAGVQ